MTKTIQVNTRIEPDLANQLDALVKATGRTRPAIVYQAIRDLVDRERAFFAAVERGMAQAHAGDGTDLEAFNDELESIIADHRKPH